jgi:HAD superfamily hydrolase (TIGR01509 family)
MMDTVVVDPFFDGVETLFGQSFETLVAELTPGAWVEFELGRIDEATFLSRMFRDGRHVDARRLRDWLCARYRYVEGMDALLDDLVEADVEMHVLSNYPCWHTYIEQTLGLARRLPWTFVSCETGVRKPDPQAFTGAARALSVAPADCLFVDDREANCEAAIATGMNAVVFRDAAHLRACLVDLGALSDAS